MRKNRFIQIICLILIGSFFLAPHIFAEDIKSRMLERKPAIDALKARGILGENNKGYLEFIGNQKESESIINAENEDRSAVYTTIAKQQGTTPELVGKRRAMQIEERSEPGHWVQNQEGKWYKK